MSYYFLLIPGTFAPNSSWTDQDSSFSKSIESSLRSVLEGDGVKAPQDIIFEKCIWTAENNDDSRNKGVEDGLDKLRDSDASNCFIIAHSHGGNIATKIASRLLAEKREKKLNGIITINTPFFFINKRSFLGRLKLIKYLLKLFVFLIVTYFVSVLYISGIDKIDSLNGLNYILIAFIILILLFAWKSPRKIIQIFVRGEDGEKNGDAAEVEDEIYKNYYHNTSVFAVNSVSDEATGPLAFMTSIAMIPFTLSHSIFILLIAIVSFSYHLITFSVASLLLAFASKEIICNTHEFNRIDGLYDCISEFKNDPHLDVYFKIFPPISENIFQYGYLYWDIYFNIVHSNLSITLYYIEISKLITASAIMTLIIVIGFIFVITILSLFFNFILEKAALGVWVERERAETERGQGNSSLWNVIRVRFFEFFGGVIRLLLYQRGVSSMPQNGKEVRFYDAGISEGFLIHSASYSDPSCIRAMVEWIREKS